MQIKKISSKTKNKIYKIDIILDEHIKNGFYKGDKVFNKMCDLQGRITDIQDNTIFVQYQDKTIERINKDIAFDVLSYVDDTQTVVAPMTPQISDKKVSRVMDNLEKSEENEKPRNIKINRTQLRINEELENYQQNKERKLKSQKIDDLIELAVTKGIIQQDEADIEKVKLANMNDRDFSEYEDNVLNFNSQSIVTSGIEEDDFENDPTLTEEEKALKRIKSGRNMVATNIDYSKIKGGTTRNIESLASNKKNSILNNTLTEQQQFSTYNKNSWMDELDWTTIFSKR